MYVNEVSGGLSDPKAKPSVIKDSPSTAYVDGHNGIGSVSTCTCTYTSMVPCNALNYTVDWYYSIRMYMYVHVPRSRNDLKVGGAQH